MRYQLRSLPASTSGGYAADTTKGKILVPLRGQCQLGTILPCRLSLGLVRKLGSSCQWCACGARAVSNRRQTVRRRHADLLASLPSRPGELHPEPLTDPDLTLSRHPARAIARRLPPSAEDSGSSRLTRLTQARRRWPAPFAPRALPRFSANTEQSAPNRRIGTFGLAVGAACAFSLSIAV